jgi:hypothetical protein
MVEAVRAGASRRAVARRFGVSLPTVQRWVARAGTGALDAVDWGDRSSAPRRQARRASPAAEGLVRRLRIELAGSVLGEHGALAIRLALETRSDAPRQLPSVRTIGRILERGGLLDGRRRVRHPPPPRGWYLPDVREHRQELDQMDSIEELRLVGGIPLEVLTLISLHGALPAAWPGPRLVTDRVIGSLLEHWRAHGLPGYAQFDNALVFAGTHARPDLGRVARTCLSLGVTPVYAPPRETGFQAAIEAFNGRWRRACWERPDTLTMASTRDRSTAWLEAWRTARAVRIEAAPPRSPFPADFDPEAPPVHRGRVVYLRRTDGKGFATVLTRRFEVAADWPHRLVRAEVDLDIGAIRFHALRRQQPDDHPLLRTVPFQAPWPPLR